MRLAPALAAALKDMSGDTTDSEEMADHVRPSSLWTRKGRLRWDHA
jgi:hypothetical protein